MRTNYFGTANVDQFTATDIIRETFYGYEDDDVFEFYTGGNVFLNGDFSDRFIGGTGADRVEGLEIDFTADFSYDDFAGLSFDGGRGYDTVAFDIKMDLQSLSRDFVDFDLARFVTSSRSVEHRQFEIEIDLKEDDLNNITIEGDDGDETVFLNFDTGDYTDSFVNVSLNGGDDRFEFTSHSGVDTYMIIDTGAGSDVVILNANQGVGFGETDIRVNTGGKDDLIVLEGMNGEFVNAGSGDDEIYIITGGFNDKADTIRTGKGEDRIYLELDEYSKIAKFKDFDETQDTIVFDAAEFRDTTVTFDAAVADASEDPMLYMNNATGKLFFGGNVMATFGGATSLTQDNFETDTWDFFSV